MTRGAHLRGQVSTPLGPFSFVLNARGVERCGFDATGASRGWRGDADAARLASSVEAYFRGEPEPFDVPVDDSRWTAFQRDVYALTRAIPYGETRAYGDIAAVTASGARAVGRAMAALPVPLIVPAHRVIRADGSLGGFRGREALKAWLIDFEASNLAKSGAR